ncbi:hypothetical protein [Paenibacillus brasilensis]|uniref:Uncharacterized protein n=1 Tax=Paenibacillus brasilensis TaxID=128574 RepID=A0ABU0KX68_9BACL|nr:hypothetical protein [Paenibacillus brasilensis]MDQ0494046.1 hypothetical protein [Paenibacillus brasilensis]
MTERNWQEDMNGCTGLPPTPWAWVSTEEAEWIEDSNQEIVIGSEDEYIFDDLLGPNVRKEAFMRFMINAPEALPYWLQQVMKLEKELEESELVNWMRECKLATERHAAADRDRTGAYKALEQAERRKRIEEEKNEILKNNIKVISDNLKQAESLIQQKDAEIAELKRLAEFWESQYSDASTHGDETEERLNAELNRLNSLLQDEGDTP